MPQNTHLLPFHILHKILSQLSPPQAGWTPLSFGLNQTDSDLSLTLYTFFFSSPDVVILLTAVLVGSKNLCSVLFPPSLPLTHCLPISFLTTDP